MGDALPPGYTEMNEGPDIGNLNLDDDYQDDPPPRNPKRGGAQRSGGGRRQAGGRDSASNNEDRSTSRQFGQSGGRGNGRAEANEGGSPLGPNKTRAGQDDWNDEDDEPTPPARQGKQGSEGQGRQQQRPRAGQDDWNDEDNESNPPARQGRQGQCRQPQRGGNAFTLGEDAEPGESGRSNGYRGGRDERNWVYGGGDDRGTEGSDYGDDGADYRPQGRGRDPHPGPRNALARVPRGRSRTPSPRGGRSYSPAGRELGYDHGPSRRNPPHDGSPGRYPHEMQGRQPLHRIIEHEVFVPVPMEPSMGMPMGTNGMNSFDTTIPYRYVSIGDRGCITLSREMGIPVSYLEWLEDEGGIFFDRRHQMFLVDPEILLDDLTDYKYVLLDNPWITPQARMAFKWRMGMLDHKLL